jgi:hypothetical protein
MVSGRRTGVEHIRRKDGATVVLEDVDFPGETTKQSFMASRRPAVRRYSLTARGRSRSPSMELPTGSSSFEGASGCMRLPWAGCTVEGGCIGAGCVRHVVDVRGLRATRCPGEPGRGASHTRSSRARCGRLRGLVRTHGSRMRRVRVPSRRPTPVSRRTILHLPVFSPACPAAPDEKFSESSGCQERLWG